MHMNNHEPHLSILVLSLLMSFASAGSSAIIKTGDVLEINVQGHPEFSGTFEVAIDGTINYPMLTDEPVVNISTAELMNDLTLRLLKYVDNPVVTVSIVEMPDIAVTVLGQITTPGPVQTYEGVSLQEVIQQAGGPRENADLRRIKIVHSEKPDESAEYFNLDSFFVNGNIERLPALQDKDKIILLTEKRSTKIKVIGAVQKPGFFDLQEEEINLFELIYMAGGPSEKADLSRVRRFFKHEDKTMEEVIDVRSYVDKGNMDDIPLVSEGDVIIVYSKWFDWKTLLTILNNTLLFIVTIQAFSGVFSK
ncbi:MAG: hypothetical protein GF398_13440 [Chitinivibrionales bacterium]|nr:hypothetical protein [Chitinivibrionales bacterium]